MPITPNKSYRVQSKSNPGQFHLVEDFQGSLRCDCTAFQYRQSCRHVVGLYRKLYGRNLTKKTKAVKLSHKVV